MTTIMKIACAVVLAIITRSDATNDFINMIVWRDPMDVEVVLDTNTKGIGFTIEYVTPRETQKHAFQSDVGFAGNTEFRTFQFTYTSADISQGYLYLKDANDSVISCARWGENSMNLECAHIIEAALDSVWRLISPQTYETVIPYKGVVEADFLEIREDILGTDLHLGEANGGQYFVGDNDATSFINEIIYGVTCTGGEELKTGIEVVIYGRPSKYALVVEDAAGISGFVLFESFEFMDTELKFFDIPRFQVAEGDVFGDFSKGSAILVRLMTGDSDEVERTVLSSVAWGVERAEHTIDWASVDLSSIIGGTVTPMLSHTYFPLVVSPLALAGEDSTNINRLLVVGEEMAVMSSGSWLTSSDQSCTPGEWNVGQSLGSTSTSTTTTSGAHMLKASPWVMAMLIASAFM
eukprot:Selendium_serpulae@DN6064_c1_g1_i3.p1